MDLFTLLGKRRDEDSDLPASADEVGFDAAALLAGGVPVTPSEENRECLEALRAVIDPEVGINIVDLGLVYAVACRDGGIDVVLTMTTPACPLSAVIEEDVRDAIWEFVDPHAQVRVAVVFEPAWSPEMMSAYARQQLGR